MTRQLSTDVVVVGAGPTGLMLANWLQRFGVDHLLVDDGDGPTRESRAIILQARSLELYAQLGLVDRVRDRATEVVGVRPGWQDRPAPFTAPVSRLGRGLTPYPGFHTVEQSVNEELLTAGLEQQGGRVAWGHRVTGVQQDADAVRVGLDGADGPAEVTAQWCVGTDGAGSVVRESSGIGFSGITDPAVFYVIDAEEVTGLDHEVVNVRPGPTEFLVSFPMRGPGHHRLIGSLASDDTEDDVRAMLAERYGVRWGRSGWFARYRLHHRVADRFRQGRVLLAGDAAHVHSPLGGQGMNTGLQDAHNLAFKLADVVAGRADDALLDSYSRERRPVARRLVDTTDRAFSTVVDPRPAAVALRRWLVPVLAPVLPLLLRSAGSSRLAGIVGQWRIHYPRPADVPVRTGRPWSLVAEHVLGRRLPWTGNNHEVLRSACWQVHAYGDPPPALTGLPRLVAESHRFAARTDLGLGPGVWYLVRPDGFVQAAAPPDAAAADFTSHLRVLGYGDEVLSAR